MIRRHIGQNRSTGVDPLLKRTGFVRQVLRILALLAILSGQTATGQDASAAQQERLKQRDAIEARAQVLIQKGDWAAAVDEVLKMLKIEREVRGNDHDEVAGSLELLRELYLRLDNFDAARKWGQELLSVRTRRFGQSDWRVTNARLELKDVDRFQQLAPADRKRLRDLVDILNESVQPGQDGQTKAAIDKSQRVLDLYRRLLGNQHPAVASILDRLSGLSRTQGDLPQATAFGREALEIRRQVLGEKHPDYAVSLNAMALLHEAAHEFTQAATLYRRAFDITVTACGESHADCLTYLENLAQLHESQGERRSTIAVREEIRELVGRVKGESNPRYAAALNDLALVYDDLGDYVRAEPLYRQAVQIARAAPGEEAEFAKYLHNLARLHYEQADFPKAEALYLEALPVLKRIHGAGDPRYALCLNNLAILYYQQGNMANAEPLCRQALEIRKAALGENGPEYAASLNVLAAILDDQGRFPEAETLCLQAMGAVGGEGGKHPEYPSYLNNLAMLLRNQGKFDRAEPLFRKALDVWGATLGEQHPNYALALKNLAETLLCLGRSDEALDCARRAARIQRINVDALASIQSDRQQFLAARFNRNAVDALVSVLVDRGRPADDDYNEVLQAKGRIWKRQVEARAAAFAAANQPEIAPQIEQLRRLSARRASLILNPPDAVRRDAWRDELAELAEKQEDIERTLFEKNAALRHAGRPVTIADVRSHLPPGTAVIDFVEYTKSGCRPMDQSDVRVERRMAAFVIRGDADTVAVVDLGPAQALSDAVDAWRRSLGLPKEGHATGQQLRRIVWQPLQPHVQGSRLVLVSPDGALGRFPLSALPGTSPETYLLEEIPLAVIPCIMALPRMLGENPGEPPRTATGNLLVLGNVDYDNLDAPAAPVAPAFGRKVAAIRGAGGKSFGPLAATRGELATIEKLYRETYGDRGITLLEGTQARKDRFCLEAPRHKYLHLATHGFFASPSFKSQLETGAGRAVSLENAAATREFAPGLLSGLAFAGANQPPRDDRDNGILTAAEVENLDLRGVQLTVLSACETGLGEVAGGEGLLGLQRAFQVAGAQTVVASLWEVSDSATRTLMERFHENLLKKRMGSLEALRDAQLWMLRDAQKRGLVRVDPNTRQELERTPPFYWAGFVLSGDWR